MIVVQSISNLINKHGLVAVLFYTIMVRLLVFLCYNGITYFPDSGDYIEFADLIVNGTTIGYHGARTPGYPLFLALFGNNHGIVVLIQNILGILNILFIYQLCEKMLSKQASLIICLLLSSYLPFVFYDFAILTESLTAFLVLLLFWFMVKNSVFTMKMTYQQCLIMGLICGALFLVRPFFIYLPVLIVVFFAIKTRYLFSLKLVTLLFIPLTFFLCWNTFNKYNTDAFMTSSYEGINLTQVGTTFYEKIPDNHSQIRDVLLKHRAETIATKPDYAQPMVIWFAREELLSNTGMSDLELSLCLKEMSIELIKNNPIDYLQQVGHSFFLFFGQSGTLLWDVNHFNSLYVRKGLIGLWIYIQSYALIALNGIFLLLSIIFLWKNKSPSQWNLPHFTIFVVLSGAIFQALITYGTNARFCYPFTAIILITTVFLFNHFVILKKLKTVMLSITRNA